MKKYLFVVVLQDPLVPDEDQVTAFAHAFITADSEQEAYSKGGKLYDSGELINHMPEWVGLNDYVVELPHRLSV